MATDIIARGMIAEHTDNSDIHVTVGDKENWNSHPNDVQASGNPVQLDGLQGGVPFSEMVVSGKNLFDGSLTVGMVATANGTIVASKKCISTTNLISVEPNTRYIAQNSENKTLDAVVYFDKNKSVIGHTYISATGFNSFSTPDKCSFIKWRYLFDTYQDDTSALTNIQLEEGNTPTAYEPPITGRELTINACGKNLIPYPYNVTTKTLNGVTLTDNGDGTIMLSGTATANIIFWLGKFTIKAGKYTVSGFNSKYKDDRAHVGVRNGQGGVISNFYETSNSSGTVTISEDTEIQPIIYVNSGATFNGDIAAPQLELGGTATDYEPYHGAQYTITPDSNPYSVPDDIRQQDGLNTVSVSEGKLSVTGVRKNAALKKLWDEIDEIKTAIIVSNGESE